MSDLLILMLGAAAIYWAVALIALPIVVYRMHERLKAMAGELESCRKAMQATASLMEELLGRVEVGRFPRSGRDGR